MISGDLLILGAASIVGFYMAYNIGANDVANAMGTSVGSHSLSFRQAIIIAAIFEFSGAILAGNHVASTIGKGIINPIIFSSNPNDYIYGMLSSLLAAGIWLNFATKLGWPVSTTHSIVGAVVGFGIIARGVHSIHWNVIIHIVASWIISPIFGGIISYIIFSFILKKILRSVEPVLATKSYMPIISFYLAFLLSMSIVYKGLKNLHLNLSIYNSLAISLTLGLVAFVLSRIYLSKVKVDKTAKPWRRLPAVERIFRYFQNVTASYMAFAHGANDVANAVGPLVGMITVIQSHNISSTAPVSWWILAFGGSGIVIGLATLGYKVIITVGRKLTDLTPSRGFSAEIGAATTILIASKLGLPISTTHVLVGSIIGVGMARGLGAIRLSVMKDIVYAWFLTLPAAMILSAIIYYLIGFIR